MGTKTRRNGETVDAVDLYMGGKVGKDAKLGTCVKKAIPCDELPEVLRQLLIEHFGAQPISLDTPPRLTPAVAMVIS